MAGFAPALSQRRRRRPLIVARSGAERKAGHAQAGSPVALKRVALR